MLSSNIYHRGLSEAYCNKNNYYKILTADRYMRTLRLVTNMFYPGCKRPIVTLRKICDDTRDNLLSTIGMNAKYFYKPYHDEYTIDLSLKYNAQRCQRSLSNYKRRTRY